MGDDQTKNWLAMLTGVVCTLQLSIHILHDLIDYHDTLEFFQLNIVGLQFFSDELILTSSSFFNIDSI